MVCVKIIHDTGHQRALTGLGSVEDLSGLVESFEPLHETSAFILGYIEHESQGVIKSEVVGLLGHEPTIVITVIAPQLEPQVRKETTELGISKDTELVAEATPP